MFTMPPARFDDVFFAAMDAMSAPDGPVLGPGVYTARMENLPPASGPDREIV
jgi:hypothetical protein